MKHWKENCARASVVLGMAGMVLLTTPMAAKAQVSGMSCDELWYERNQIYARNGYCFKTERARAEFGAGCFPPYGQLRGYEKNRVAEIQRWEARRGCN
jgi:hypothetical protein